MVHQIEIKLGAFSEGDHHKVRNFIEEVWRELVDRGWAEAKNFDGLVRPGAAFDFSFPARSSHEANAVVERLLRDHFMQRLASLTHTKKACADG